MLYFYGDTAVYLSNGDNNNNTPTFAKAAAAPGAAVLNEVQEKMLTCRSAHIRVHQPDAASEA